MKRPPRIERTLVDGPTLHAPRGAGSCLLWYLMSHSIEVSPDPEMVKDNLARIQTRAMLTTRYHTAYTEAWTLTQTHTLTSAEIDALLTRSDLWCAVSLIGGDTYDDPADLTEVADGSWERVATWYRDGYQGQESFYLPYTSEGGEATIITAKPRQVPLTEALGYLLTPLLNPTGYDPRGCLFEGDPGHDAQMFARDQARRATETFLADSLTWYLEPTAPRPVVPVTLTPPSDDDRALITEVCTEIVRANELARHGLQDWAAPQVERMTDTLIDTNNGLYLSSYTPTSAR